MEKIKDFFKKPTSLGVIGLVVGIVIGLFGLGWGLWPVKWTDAAPADLQMDYKRDYMCMMIDSYIRNPDDALVQMRWNGLGDTAGELLGMLTPTVCRFSSDQEIKAFEQIISLQQPLTQDSTVKTETPVVSIEEDEEKSFSILPLALLMLLTLVVGGVFLFLLMKKGKSPVAALQKLGRKADLSEEPERTSSHTPNSHEEDDFHAKEAPLAQFMTTYRQGDDLYDDSFSVDSLNGEFLGECGVGIAETIGVGEPKKVTALEVWLFDKNDIQTITKVLMSEHANNDPAIRQRMLSKGEPLQVEPGMKFSMETASLQLEARVVDMVYARGPLPENSYFSRLTLEISVWAR